MHGSILSHAVAVCTCWGSQQLGDQNIRIKSLGCLTPQIAPTTPSHTAMATNPTCPEQAHATFEDILTCRISDPDVARNSLGWQWQPRSSTELGAQPYMHAHTQPYTHQQHACMLRRYSSHAAGASWRHGISANRDMQILDNL